MPQPAAESGYRRGAVPVSCSERSFAVPYSGARCSSSAIFAGRLHRKEDCPLLRLYAVYGTVYSKLPPRPECICTRPVQPHRAARRNETHPAKRPEAGKQPTNPNPKGGAMAKPRGGSGGGLLDLEGHYAFYGAYHSNPVNVGIHELFVWPILLSALLLLHLAAPSAHAAGIGAAVYGAYYFLLDRRAGALAAFLCFLCWAASGALAARLGFSVGWKVVLVSQLFCWTMQFIGHGVFEKRAPALLDNLTQAFLMAPFFVLLEILHTIGGYEPYPGFHDKVSKLIEEARKEWEDKKSKKSS